ncbi:MAG: hypothetical protein V1835_06125 [Candidatus Micrarchaeota archaeon]
MELKWQDFDLAEFVRPNAFKIAVVVTFMIVLAPLPFFVNRITLGDGAAKIYYDQLGAPFGAYALYEEGGLITGANLNNLNKILVFGLIADLVFWYVVACVIIYAYGKFTGKGRLGEVS